MTTRKKLCAIKGISEAKVDKSKEVVAKHGGYVGPKISLS